MYARLAWSLTALAVAVAVGDTLVTAAFGPLWSEKSVAVHGWPFITAAGVGAAAMGSVIVSQYPRHVIGWLLCLIGVTSSISLLLEAYSFWITDADGPGGQALGNVAGWASSMLGGWLSISGLALMFMLAPDGHFQSRRWRYAALPLLVGFVSSVLALLLTSPTGYNIHSDEGQFMGVAELLFTIGFLSICLGMLISAISILRRLRKSQGVQRQQLRLIALGAAFVVIGIVAMIVVQLFNGGHQTWAASLPLFLSYFALPILFAISVLRYRLYELEVILNRALVLALGTAFAATGYTGLVVGAGATIGAQTSRFWLSLLATAVVAVAFQPLRRGVVRLSNRLAYGARAAPYEALSDFTRRIGETPSADVLLPAVAEAAGRAVSARWATAQLHVSGGGALTGAWPSTPVEVMRHHSVPVRMSGEALGSIQVGLPPGRSLRGMDERLLRDLAEQAALAFRNAALETELAKKVAALDRSTEQLAASRRRIIEADDSERRRIESAINREVIPLVAEMPTRLRTLQLGPVDSSAVDTLNELVTRTNQALEALRELTRGVFPTQLSRAGLAPSLRSLASRSGRPGLLAVDPNLAGRRFSARVEAAVYFCCVEAIRADDGGTHIELLADGSDLLLQLGCVGRDALDLQAISDRVEAVGGTLSAMEGTARADGGTGSSRSLELRIPGR
jgi:hypothetical protein